MSSPSKFQETGQQHEVYVEQNDATFKKFATFSNYNAMGQMTKQEVGNGLATDYTYTKAGQLETLRTCKPFCNYGGTVKVYQDLTYEFDQSGRIKSIIDSRDATDRQITDDFGDLIDTHSSQEFEYDKIGRLTKATWLLDNEVINYNYNEIGFMERRSSRVGNDPETFVEYLPQDQGQQTLSGFSDAAHDPVNKVLGAVYDEIGNMIQKTVKDENSNNITWNYVFDANNQLIQIHKNATLPLESNLPKVEFTYDHKGQRATKVYHRDNGSTVTTWYVSPAYEIRRDSEKTVQTTTKYVQVAGKGKIAAITQDTTAQQTALLTSAQYIQFAGFLDGRTLNSLAEKIAFNLQGYVAHPNAKHYIKTGIQILVMILFIIVTIRIVRRGAVSSFAQWQRYVAIPLICVFFMTSCQLDTENTQHSGPGNDSGTIPTVFSQQISGDTSNGIPTGVVYYHSNHIGSASMITGANGEFKTYIIYEPFGKIAQHRSAGQNTVTHKYTSQEADEESGLMYYNARYYDPDIGRFITADTAVPDVFDAQAYNRYAYVSNNPITYDDPSGHFWHVVAGAVVGAVAAAANGGSIEDILAGAAIGALAAATGAIVSSAITASLGTGAGAAIAASAASGAVSGGLSALYAGADSQSILEAAIKGGSQGAVLGAISGTTEINPRDGLARIADRTAVGMFTGGLDAMMNGDSVEQGILVGGLSGAASAAAEIYSDDLRSSTREELREQYYSDERNRAFKNEFEFIDSLLSPSKESAYLALKPMKSGTYYNHHYAAYTNSGHDLSKKETFNPQIRLESSLYNKSSSYYRSASFLKHNTTREKPNNYSAFNL